MSLAFEIFAGVLLVVIAGNLVTISEALRTHNQIMRAIVDMASRGRK